MQKQREAVVCSRVDMYGKRFGAVAAIRRTKKGPTRRPSAVISSDTATPSDSLYRQRSDFSLPNKFLRELQEVRYNPEERDYGYPWVFLTTPQKKNFFITEDTRTSLANHHGTNKHRISPQLAAGQSHPGWELIPDVNDWFGARLGRTSCRTKMADLQAGDYANIDANGASSPTWVPAAATSELDGRCRGRGQVSCKSYAVRGWTRRCWAMW